MIKYVDQKVLITTSAWFYGSSGRQYKAVWGTLKAIHEAKNLVGFTPNRSHANWLYEIGNMYVMGCQVNYILVCPEKPSDKRINNKPCEILFLD